MNTARIVSNTSLLMTLIAGSLISGCAHENVNHRIDNRLAQVPKVESVDDLNNRAVATIENSSLEPALKAKLLKLHKETQTKTQELREQSLKLRALLIQDLAQEKYNDKEVTSVKERLKTVENNKISVLFGAIDKANAILGHATGKRHREILQSMYEAHGR